jgi:transposase
MGRMRPKGTPEQLATRRARAAELLAAGQTVTAVARAIGVSRQTIYTWQAQARRPGPKRKRRLSGGQCRLKPGQQHRLERVLLKGAQAYGYATDHWTLERIGLVIFQLFGVRYSPSGVWYLMQRLGWSSQKMTRVAVQRDETAIADWQATVWPRVKKVA